MLQLVSNLTQFVSDLTQLGLVAVVANSACHLAVVEVPVVDLSQKPLDPTQIVAWECQVLEAL